MIELVLDGSWHGKSGTGRYSIELSRRIAASGAFCCHEISRKRPASPLSPVHISWELAKHKNTKIFWSPQYMPPAISSQLTVITLHDLLQLSYSSSAKSFYFRYVLRNLLQKVDKIVTVSEFSKQEIVRWSGRMDNDIIVIPNGLSLEFSAQRRAEYTGAAPYFLYVGNHRPHKNLARVIKAFSLFRHREGCILALTGHPNAELQMIAERCGVLQYIKFIGFPDNTKLAEFYRTAIATIYVSLYEGFGLPVIESMACATPVIASDIDVIRETAGDAAHLVNPCDVESISLGMAEVFYDTERRRQLIDRGLVRARLFSWDESAAALVNLLKGLVNA